MEHRFYVTVFAKDRRTLLALQDYQLDLFRATAVAARARMRVRAERAAALAQTTDARAAVAESPPDEERLIALADAPAIDGLLTLAEIGRLVEDGYRVLIERDADATAGRPGVVEFEQWLKEMGED